MRWRVELNPGAKLDTLATRVCFRATPDATTGLCGRPLTLTLAQVAALKPGTAFQCKDCVEAVPFARGGTG